LYNNYTLASKAKVGKYTRNQKTKKTRKQESMKANT